MTRKRVVVTGLGILSPLGVGAEKNWQAMMASQSGIGPISLFDASSLPTRFAGQVWDFDANHYINTKDQKKMDRFIQFSMAASKMAFEDSGWTKEEIASVADRFGVIIGTGMGGLPAIEETTADAVQKGPRRISAFFIPMVIPNLASGFVSIEWGLKGPNICVVSACATGAHAIGEASRMIQRGDADMMICGGTEAVITMIGVGGFNAMRALSTRNEEPTKASRPFDVNRDGFVMGEGVGLLVLEEYEYARKRGAKIYAEVAGYALNGDANHISQPAPEGEGGARCMALALKDAQLNPTDVDYINTHGTSTPLGDVLETMAVKRVFKDHAKTLALSSTKSMTGHLLGAAGGVESIFSILAIQRGVIPPTINLDQPDPQCDLDYTPNVPRERNIKIALSNSFGFGGTNATLIFRRV